MSYPEVPLGTFLATAIDDEPIEPEREYETAGIYSYGRGLFRKPPIQGSETRYAKYTKLHAGQFVYSKLFGWEGATAVVEDEFDGLYVSHEFPTFTINTELADRRYVAHLARWTGLHAKLKNKGTGVGSRRQRVNVSRLLETTVPLPALPEQRRISAHLDSTLGRLNAAATAQDRARSLRGALTNSLLSNAGKLAPLSSFLQPARDTVPVVSGSTYATAGIRSFGRGLFKRPAIDGADTSYTSYNRIHTGQFVYSKLFGWEGALAVVPEDFDGYHMSSEFPAFDIDASQADSSYVHHLARWPGLHASLRDKGTGVGSRRQRVSPSRLLAATVPLPDLPEQQRITADLDKIAAAERIADSQAANTKHMKISLLNAAFGGNL